MFVVNFLQKEKQTRVKVCAVWLLSWRKESAQVGGGKMIYACMWCQMNFYVIVIMTHIGGEGWRVGGWAASANVPTVQPRVAISVHMKGLELSIM